MAAVAQGRIVQRWEESAAIARPLTPPERDALAADIAARGVIYPVLVLPDGRIVDGHHRWELSAGQAPIHVLPAMTDQAALYLAGQLNHARRHLDAAEWKSLLTAQERRRLAVAMLAVKTQAEVATAFGVSQASVASWKKAARTDTLSETDNAFTPAGSDNGADPDPPPSGPSNGVKDHRQALTDRQRKELTRLYWKGTPAKDLATRFGVSLPTVRRVANAAGQPPKSKATKQELPSQRVTRSRRIYSFNDPLTAPIGASLSGWSATILSIIEFTKALRDQGVRPLVRQWPPQRIAQTRANLDMMIGQIQQLRDEVAEVEARIGLDDG